MTARRFDIVVIGAGPGGYVAALRAAGLGLSVAVVERDRLGGVCANQGCIPTKALLRSAEVYATVRHAAEFGVRVEGVSFDLAAIVERAGQVAARMEKTVASLLRSAKVEVLHGEARLAGQGRVVVATTDGESTLEAGHVILATGARPRVPSGLEGDGRLVWTYREALAPKELPSSLVIVGAGPIGVEFASFYGALGVEVTLVEMLARVLPQEDEEISEAMGRALKKQGIRVLTSAAVVSVEKAEEEVRVVLEVGGKAESLAARRLLVATGIVANLEGLGLETTGVVVERGRIVVDEWMRTGEPGVYAIGDITGAPWLAHKASAEAAVCVDGIVGAPGARPLPRGSIPACTYANPQVASVGFTEAAARAAGLEVRCGRATFVGNGKARALGDTTGFVKTVFDAKTGELLGAHLIGPEVTELVSTFTLARTLEATEAEILATVFPHPTLAEALHESVAAAFAHN